LRGCTRHFLPSLGYAICRVQVLRNPPHVTPWQRSAASPLQAGSSKMSGSLALLALRCCRCVQSIGWRGAEGLLLLLLRGSRRRAAPKAYVGPRVQSWMWTCAGRGSLTSC
jgi:hypothetical protein